MPLCDSGCCSGHKWFNGRQFRRAVPDAAELMNIIDWMVDNDEIVDVDFVCEAWVKIIARLKGQRHRCSLKC